ncbi:MAG: hypothetical protein GXO25_07765 [Euryarchaeota archaeon]|uniref:4-vinyl reductase 4VR domain-containing protein n=1 Tax=uncultured euryarchaeote Alv-FOS4 TaxID=337893 RepID=Q3SA56_9EURY|nr:hypothetical protein [uncultured euryarchaeote Alv-FOS4]NPA75956.1 hypothetical protein [Euryarchaeota archaeon]
MEESVARTIYVFGELTKMEVAINTAITKSKVPTNEIRHLLKSLNKYQAERTPLFQYISYLFRDIGLGELKCHEFSPYRIVVGVYNSRVPGLFSEVRGRTCYITADALKMFFEKDMDILTEVKELKCVNEGHDHCEFEINMDPLDVLKFIVEKGDIEYMKKLKNGEKGTIDELRKLILEKYGLIKGDELTILGKKYLDIEPVREMDEIHRPWKKLSEISEVTASANSFAEAFSKTIEEEEVKDIDESKIINVVEEVENSRSFAELVAKVMNKEVKDDE